ncbi:Histone-lysine N-methyltransferase family member SUVH9 [Striga hermonthica]|uniref:Histone-lysine N-methyltransferase family member SUVH9 n=1 Tax=Striga hermonthica TaxID=68872 RepID=A0A9N7NCE2_STRHE|nr:Histone-lysine N-methyltransferase family member SUVH9 [Striga hermonthica]
MGSTNYTAPFPGRPDLPSTSTSTPTLLVPKIEPKLEPFDESSPYPPSFYHLSSSLPVPTPNKLPLSCDFDRLSDTFLSATSRRKEPRAGSPTGHKTDPNPLAIFSVPDGTEPHLSSAPSPCGVRKCPIRSSEMVRVTDLKPEDSRYFRGSIRRARMIYESLRVFAVAEDERRREVFPNLRKCRTRAHLKAAAVMRERGLWLNRDKRVVGTIPGVEIGDVFFVRIEMCVVGLHGQSQAGIDYVPISQSLNREPIATSIIVSGGYEDGEDAGDVIVYSGHGGQDKNGRQVEHQRLEWGNLAMERSMHYGIEVRVIRGFKYEGSAIGKVYVYDGLYKVVETWFDMGRSGYGIYKFRLVRNENQEEMGSSVMRFAMSLKTRPLESRPVGYMSLDLSGEKENFRVLFFNDVDSNQDPIHYEYLARSVFPPSVYDSGSGGSGCACARGCMEGCLCWVRNGGDFAYHSSGILVRGKPLVFECGPHCQCPPECRNRVTQKGLRNRFEVFRSRETNWKVRSLDLIPAGSFVCEYSGVVLTREQAHLLTMNGDSLIYPDRFGERWREWGNLSEVFADFLPSSYPSLPPLDFSMDVSRMRNLACYISNSTSPNVFVQPVLYDHTNVSFPRLMLFAMENIPPMRELSLDYGVATESTGKLALCN